MSQSTDNQTSMSDSEIDPDDRFTLPSVDDGKILIVDDEEDVADLHEYRLGKIYNTTAVYGGEAALEQLNSTFDVVVLDRRMPDMTGGEVLTELRKRNYGCYVIMATAVEPTGEILEMPFDEYMEKPVGANELIDNIERSLAIRTKNELTERIERVQNKIELMESKYTAPQLQSSEDSDSDSGTDSDDEPDVAQIQQDYVSLNHELDALQDKKQDIESEFSI
jgi:DNA-binding response OmpR family regulator